MQNFATGEQRKKGDGGEGGGGELPNPCLLRTPKRGCKTACLNGQLSTKRNMQT